MSIEPFNLFLVQATMNLSMVISDMKEYDHEGDIDWKYDQ